MKQTVNLYDFREAFKNHGRQEQFSYDGLEALFDHLEEYEESTGEDVELDVIAFCCEYTEYDSIAEFNDNYGEDCETLEDVKYFTQVIPVNKYEDKEGNEQQRFIIQDY